METNYLKNWYIVTIRGRKIVVCGDIFRDIKGRFPDGTHIQTSRVLKVDFVNGVVETRNSVYHLELGGEK